MTTGSELGVVTLLIVAAAPNLPVLIAGWALAGIAVAATFYQPAFAALTRWWAPDHVRALTIVTLAGGLASPVFAPLTAALADHLSRRHTYLVLAGILATVTISAHALALRAPWPDAPASPAHTTEGAAASGAAGRSSCSPPPNQPASTGTVKTTRASPRRPPRTAAASSAPTAQACTYPVGVNAASANAPDAPASDVPADPPNGGACPSSSTCGRTPCSRRGNGSPGTDPASGLPCGLRDPPVRGGQAGPRRGNVCQAVVQAVPFRVKPEGLAKAPLEVPWNPKVT
ncbi:hypothetical protein GCM10010228_58710 [Streptomyces massasporeus]|nr:hypothetical protein GCM10010228_58710 [Streptomyces massasporeus]